MNWGELAVAVPVSLSDMFAVEVEVGVEVDSEVEPCAVGWER